MHWSVVRQGDNHVLVRVGFGNALVSRAGGKVERLRSGFSENAFSYLLFLRLVPIFPFWLVNLAAALLSVPLRTFALTTAVGIIPGSAIFASFGGGVGAILDDGGPIDLANVLTPSVVLPIAALSASVGVHAISKIEPQQGYFPALEPEVARRPRWRPQGSLKPTWTVSPKDLNSSTTVPTSMPLLIFSRSEVLAHGH